MGWNDENAIEAARSFQRGEEKGFSYFFNSLYSPLNYFAFRIVNDLDLAEDVVEESFIKIWRRHSDFTHPKVIKSWMYTTVKNGALNRLQQISRDEKINNDIGYNIDYIELSVDNKIIQAEVYHEIMNHIEYLPTACKRIFELMYKEGLTPKETSKNLGLSISTIKNQKARGIKLILNWITKRGTTKKPKTSMAREKSQVQLLRENNSKAWYKLYEDYQSEFEDKLVYAEFSKETKENIIYDAIDHVRGSGCNLPTVRDYATNVKNMIRQKRYSLEKEKRDKERIRKQLLVKKPVYAIKPITPMKGLG